MQGDGGRDLSPSADSSHILYCISIFLAFLLSSDYKKLE